MPIRDPTVDHKSPRQELLSYNFTMYISTLTFTLPKSNEIQLSPAAYLDCFRWHNQLNNIAWWESWWELWQAMGSHCLAHERSGVQPPSGEPQHFHFSFRFLGPIPPFILVDTLPQTGADAKLQLIELGIGLTHFHLQSINNYHFNFHADESQIWIKYDTQVWHTTKRQ